MESHSQNLDAEEDIMINALIPITVSSADRNYQVVSKSLYFCEKVL